jgi:uncharacterized protein (DUF934 family)
MKFIDKHNDPWRSAGGEDGPIAHPLPAAHLLLTWEQWRVVREDWPEGLPTGVLVPNDVDIEGLAPDLPRLALVALQFPKMVDGRAYSQARLLRSRFRFTGQVRAIGDVIADMVLLLQRTGFDEVVLRGDQKIEHAERALTFFPGHYQGDLVEPRPLFARPADERRAPEFVQQGAAI